jgi:hypothetical protein
VESIVMLAFLLLLAGAISLLILLGRAIARKVKGPTPVDPDPPPALQRSYTNVITAVLVTLVILGALSFAVLYVIGSALAVR